MVILGVRVIQFLGVDQVQAFTFAILFVIVLPGRPLDKEPTDPTFNDLRKLQMVQLSDPHFECGRVRSGQHWSKSPS